RPAPCSHGSGAASRGSRCHRIRCPGRCAWIGRIAESAQRSRGALLVRSSLIAKVKRAIVRGRENQTGGVHGHTLQTLRSSLIAKVRRVAIRGHTLQTLRSSLIAKKSPGAIFDIAPAMARRETAKDGGRKIKRAGMAGPFGVHAYSMSLSADR